MVRDQYSAASISYLHFNLHQSACGKCTIHRSTNPDWQSTYSKENLFEVDPSVKLATTSLIPLDWSTMDAVTSGAISYFEAADKCRIGSQGLTFSIRGDSGDISVFNVNTNHDKADWQLYKQNNTCDLQMIFMYFYETIIKLRERPGAGEKQDLSYREIECLKWCSRGKSYWEISVILEISERTVNFHMTSVRNKLNAVTNAQAVAIGILNGMFLPSV